MGYRGGRTRVCHGHMLHWVTLTSYQILFFYGWDPSDPPAPFANQQNKVSSHGLTLTSLTLSPFSAMYKNPCLHPSRSLSSKLSYSFFFLQQFTKWDFVCCLLIIYFFFFSVGPVILFGSFTSNSYARLFVLGQILHRKFLSILLLTPL